MTSISSLTSYTLAPLDDQLYLLGTANINGTGNIKANAIFGNIADNILSGGQGSDSWRSQTPSATESMFNRMP